MRVITGYLQTYDWGAPGAFNAYLPGERGDGPQAELWFGVHPHGPSPLRDSEGTLAESVPDGSVPLLVKLLAAARPLSIQVHPPAELAARMFAEDSSLVSDDRSKNELLIALEPFSVFAGWRDCERAADILAATDPSLSDAAEAVRSGDSVLAAKILIGLPSAEVQRLTQPFLAAVSQRTGTEELHSFALCAESHPGDAGLLVAALLDHRMLAPGTAVYMPAGGVHAYVQGMGIEVMTSSDNVLRLGLTHKAVAVKEALEVAASDSEPHFLGGDVRVDHGHPAMTAFRPLGAPFTAGLLRHDRTTAGSGVFRCVVGLGGQTTVTCGDEVLELGAGEAAVILADEPEIEIVADGSAGVVLERRG